MSLKLKGWLQCDIIMVCYNTFLAIIQQHNSEGEIVTIFQIWLATELVTLIFGAHLETELIVELFCAVGLNMYEASKV